MGNTAREINQMVHEAATKQKAMAKLKEDTEKIGFTTTAVDVRKKMQEELKKTKTDHSKTFMVILSVIAAVFVIAIIYQFVQLNRDAKREVWKRPVIEKEDVNKAKAFLAGILEKTNIRLAPYISPDAPSPWKRNTEKVYLEVKGHQYQILEVIADGKHLGKNALFKAACQSPDQNVKVDFLLVYSNNEFLILKSDKTMAATAAQGDAK